MASIPEIFDDVMRHPGSQRGLDVETTARLLAEALKREAPQAYETQMRAMEAHYVEQFLNTAASVPGFAERIRRAMAHYM